MTVGQAYRKFNAAMNSARDAGDRVMGLPYSLSSAWRRTLNDEGVACILEALGTELPHPVAAAVHARFDNVFVLVAGGSDRSWREASDTLYWMATPSFKAQLVKWKELATLAPEYVEGLM